MGYGTTPNSTINADLVAADIDAIVDGICGDNSPAGYGSYSANLGDLLSVLDYIDSNPYEIQEYLSGSYSGPLTYCEENLYYIEQFLNDSASDGLIFQIQQDIAAMKAKLDNLTFDGSNNLKVITA